MLHYNYCGFCFCCLATLVLCCSHGLPCLLLCLAIVAPCMLSCLATHASCFCALLHYSYTLFSCLVAFLSHLVCVPCCTIIMSRYFAPCSHTLLHHSHALLFSTITPCYSHLSPCHCCPTIAHPHTLLPCYPPFSGTSYTPPPHFLLCCLVVRFHALLPCFVNWYSIITFLCK